MAMDAATIGRFSITYYQEIDDFYILQTSTELGSHIVAGLNTQKLII